MACRPPAKGGDRQIVLAVAIEVGGLDVGDARPVVQPRHGAELALAHSLQPDHSALLVVGRKERAHVANEDVLDAVAVDVCKSCVRRVRNTGERLPTAGPAVTVPLECPARGEDDALTHVGPEQVQPPVAVDVFNRQARHRWRRRHVCHRQRAPLEAYRGVAGRGPGFWRRQSLGSLRLVEGKNRRHVRRELDRWIDLVGWPDGRQTALADEVHAHELVTPAIAREDVRRRKRVTAAAGDASELVVGHGRHILTRRWPVLPDVSEPQKPEVSSVRTTRHGDAACRNSR